MNRLETTEGQAQHLVDSYFEALTKISREKGLFFLGAKSIVKRTLQKHSFPDLNLHTFPPDIVTKSHMITAKHSPWLKILNLGE